MTTLAPPRPAAVKKRLAPAYQSVNPYNGKVGKSFATLTGRQLEAKLGAAALCY